LPQTAEVSDYRGIFFVNANIGWAVGGSSSNNFSTIIKTTDSGANWIEQTASTTNYLRAVFFISETTGWVGGNNGTIFKTTDGGTSRDQQTINSIENIYSIKFLDTNTGWLSGGSALILHTTDGGSNWIVQNSGATYHLNSISIVNANYGWAVGGAGNILHTSNGGVTFIEGDETGKILAEFKVLQNFPNPFNPSTKISYSIPELSFVALKVYNVLGDEIATLVNEEKPAGNYEINFSAEGLTSGIYFYKLQVGNLTETKKMILLR
jgi:hypothetical protein